MVSQLVQYDVMSCQVVVYLNGNTQHLNWCQIVVSFSCLNVDM